MYYQKIINKSDVTKGMKVNGIPINNISYTDDATRIANSQEDLQRILYMVLNASEAGLFLNKKATYMTITKSYDGNIYLYTRKIVERVDTCLGTIINTNSDCTPKIRSRIAKLRATFIKMKKKYCAAVI